jgi:hypothetical protein
MKRTVASLMFVGLISAGSAFAQDTMPRSSAQEPYSQQQMAPNQSTTTSTTTTTSSSSTKHEAMKDCVAREQAGNTSMSKTDAKKACHDAFKAQKDAQSSTPDNEPRPQ